MEGGDLEKSGGAVEGVTWKRVGVAVEGDDLEKKGAVEGVTWKRRNCGRGWVTWKRVGVTVEGEGDLEKKGTVEGGDLEKKGTVEGGG